MTKNALCQEKNGLPGILFVSTILAFQKRVKTISYTGTYPDQGSAQNMEMVALVETAD